jgi:hypothetical protein
MAAIPMSLCMHGLISSLVETACAARSRMGSAFKMLIAQDGKYRVRLYGEWILVPDDAVVTEPNKFGPAVVWPYMDAKGVTQIRCFLPGAGT